MKHWKQILLLFTIALLIWFNGNPIAIAETESADAPFPVLSSSAMTSSAVASDAKQSPTVQAFPPFTRSLWEKLERLQQDKQLQELVEQDMERSIAVRAQIQAEVDRAFNHTTTLLNVLIAVLTCLPVLAAIGIWFIRRSVLNQIVAETKKQLRDEVEKQLEAEVIAELKSQLKSQAEVFQTKIENLEAEFQVQLSQLKNLFSDTQKQKDQIIQELAQITPSPIREVGTPETQQKIQFLTQQLERLKSANAQLAFTANDYVEQGKALYFENRYEEAIACYDKALQTEPENAKAWFSRGAALVKLQKWEEALVAYDRAIAIKSDFPEAWFGRGTVLTKQSNLQAAIAAFDQAIQINPELVLAWFGKARCYALQNQPEPALENLQQAIRLSPDRSKSAAKNDAAFDAIRDAEAFKMILE
jgi:tetratricopeptide (TPR) repeat protein